MPALLISAVDSAADKLTHVAHGLATGDGPVAIYTPNGTYPGGLAGVTDYYAIRVDADNIKLATSNANALLGTAIDITTNGSGTIYVLVGIPYRRARTYVAAGVSTAGAQVKSVDLNALQDSLEDLWNLLSGQAQATYNGLQLASASEAGSPAIIQHRDWKGHIRSVVDHLGYRGGQMSEWEEHWRGATMSTDWTLDTGGGAATAAPTDPTANFTQRGLLFTSGATPFVPKLSTQYLNFVDNDAVVVLTGTLRTPAALQGGGNSDNVCYGLRFDNGGAVNNGFDFRYSNANANWLCRWIAAGVDVTVNDSGVAVVAGTNYRFRLELLGSNNTSQAANTMQARAFINGVLVSTINVAAWTADKAKLFFGWKTSTSESYVWTLGRIRYVFNHVLSGDGV